MTLRPHIPLYINSFPIHLRVLYCPWEDDPRYAGRPITRKELELDDQDKEENSIAAAGRHCIYAVTFLFDYQFLEESGEESVLKGSGDSLEDQSTDLLPSDYVSINQSNSTTHMVKEVVEQPFPTLSVQSVQDELEKSHAVKHQTGTVVNISCDDDRVLLSQSCGINY